MEYIDKVLEFIKNNQTVLAMFGLGGAGAIIMWLKGIPKAIFDLFKREFTTEMVVTSQNVIFFDVLKLIEKLYSGKNLRRYKALNRWGYDGEAILAMGYGTHLLKYKKTCLLVTLNKESANQTSQDKDSLVFLKFGRGHKIFDEMLSESRAVNKDASKNKVYRLEDSNWSYVKDQKKRPLESVFLENNKKNSILKTLDDFINNEGWYVSHGVPYQLGILLYGPPGTGKTSLIKAISAYLDYDIYYLPASSLSKIERAVSSLPDKSILVVEDIDANSLTNKRLDGILMTPEEKFSESYEKIGLSEILNSIDGLFSPHGRILIATTNHIETLDAALIRPGRIDLKVEVGYVNKEILKSFFDGFFPDNRIDFDKIKGYKEDMTVSMLQNLVLMGKTQEEILDFCIGKE